MKLLLTSGGLSNKSIVNSLRLLVGKPFEDTKIAFIPTAANTVQGDKDWVINDLKVLESLQFNQIDIVDFSAVSKDIWLPRLKSADILFFEGGSNFHLMRSISSSGFIDEIEKLLETKVWMGVSAGSMVVSPEINLEDSHIIYNEDLEEEHSIKALALVDFYIFPHLNSEWFPKVTESNILEQIRETKRKIYVIDDNCAMQIINKDIKIISEGRWFEIN